MDSKRFSEYVLAQTFSKNVNGVVLLQIEKHTTIKKYLYCCAWKEMAYFEESEITGSGS